MAAKTLCDLFRSFVLLKKRRDAADALLELSG